MAHSVCNCHVSTIQSVYDYQPVPPAIAQIAPDGRLTPRQLARDQIAQLAQKYKAIPEAERPSLTEANVLRQFISPCLLAQADRAISEG